MVGNPPKVLRESGACARFWKARSVQKGDPSGCGTCGFHGGGQTTQPLLLTFSLLPEHGGGVGKGQLEREKR